MSRDTYTADSLGWISTLLTQPTDIVPSAVYLQAAPCWLQLVCQASSSCRSWRSWSWPTALGPLRNSSNTTPSTCPAAWSSSKTTDPSHLPTDRPTDWSSYFYLRSPSSSSFFSQMLARRLTSLPALPPHSPVFLHTPLSRLTHRQTKKWEDGRCQTRGWWNGIWASFEMMLEWKAWCDVLSYSKFLFQINTRFLFTRESFSKDADDYFCSIEE